MAESLVSLIGAGRSFDGVEVVHDVTFDVFDGEMLALIGPSGAGKSTLLRMIAGLIPPSSGEVRSGGRVLTGLNPDTAMVFQSFALLPWLNAADNVALPLEARGVPAAERLRQAAHLLDLVGLGGHARAYPRELSGGMRQRVGLARALCQAPRVLLLDEPFSALDVLTAHTLRDQVVDLLREAAIPTRTAVMVTHSVEEAAYMADRVVALRANPGRVVDVVTVDAPRPRRWGAPELVPFVDRLYALMT